MGVFTRLLQGGSQVLRDAGVLALLLLCLAPFWWLWPRGTAALLCAWFVAFQTPLPRRALRWLVDRGGADAGADAGLAGVAVLAGGFQGDGALSPRSLRRLRHGVRLAQERGLPLCLCGGVDNGARTEAQALALAARELGFTGPLRLEERSRTTLENLLALRESQAETGPLLLLTCPHHAPRLERLCRALQRPGTAAPRVSSYPVAWLPAGARGGLTLGVESLYEVAVHLYLWLRHGAVLLRVCPPLGAVRRAHLSGAGS